VPAVYDAGGGPCCSASVVGGPLPAQPSATCTETQHQ